MADLSYMKRRTFLQSLAALPIISSLFGVSKPTPLAPVEQVKDMCLAGRLTRPFVLSPDTTYYFRTREGEPIEVSTGGSYWSDWYEYDPKTGKIKNG